MRRKLPPGTKQRALDLLASGMDPRKVAAEVDVSISTIHKWREASLPKSDAPIAEPVTPVQSPDGSAQTAGAAGAGLSHDPSGPNLAQIIGAHPGTGFVGVQSPLPGLTPPPVPPAPQPKPMDPEALIAVVGVTKTMIVQTVATAWKISLTPEETTALCDFSEVEKKSLQTLAPFAADYTGAMEKYTKPVMAVLFAGVVAFSTVQSVKVLKMKRAETFPKDKKKSKGK